MYAPSGARSTRRSRCGPTVPTGTPTPTSTSPRTASSSATTASSGAPRASARTICTRSARSTGRDVLEIGCGAGQCSRWVLVHGGRPVGIDVSMRQLQHSRRIDEEHGVVVPTLCASAAGMPFGDATLRRRLLRLRRAPVRRRRRRPGRGRRAGAAARRRVRVLDHPPDALDVPRRPRRGGSAGLAVLLGPDAVRRGRRRDRRDEVRRAPPHPRRLGGRAGPLRLPDHRPARAGVAGRARPHLGRLEQGARHAHPRFGRLRGPSRRTRSDASRPGRAGGRAPRARRWCGPRRRAGGRPGRGGP